jgi:hypothetical protein
VALALYTRWLRRGAATDDLAGRRLLRWSLTGLYVGALLGAAAAYVWWRSAPAAVERAFFAVPRSRYEFGVLELLFSAALWEIWLRMWTRRSAWKWTAWWLALAATTNVVYHFPVLFSVLGVLSTRTLPPGTTVRFVAMLADAEVAARALHFVLASLAVGAAALLVLATKLGRDSTIGPNDDTAPGPVDVHDSAYDALKRTAALWALLPTLAQWGIGLWVLTTLPIPSRDMLLGDDVFATTLFGLSLGSVVVLMHHLATAAFGRTSAREVRNTVAWLAVTIVLMTGVRHLSRKPLYVAGDARMMDPVPAARCVATPSPLFSTSTDDRWL